MIGKKQKGKGNIIGAYSDIYQLGSMTVMYSKKRNKIIEQTLGNENIRKIEK